MPQSVRAVVVDPSHSDKLTLQSVELPPAAPDDVTVRVTAISLNRGEVNRALSQSDRRRASRLGLRRRHRGTRAADGSGPPVGTRVVGMLATGAWAERIRAPSHAVAALPDAVTDAQAATLPVAGLTALHALRQGGLLLGPQGAGRWCHGWRRASRGAACRGRGRRGLWPRAPRRAERDDRRVVRRPHHRGRRSARGGVERSLSPDPGFGRRFGAVRRADDAATERHLRARSVFRRRRQRHSKAARSSARAACKLYGLILFHELRTVEPAGAGLAVLARRSRAAGCARISRSRRHGPISPPIARRLIAREFVGKAVLHVT